MSISMHIQNLDKFYKRVLKILSRNETSSPMGNDPSPGSQHNVWRYHNLGCSKAGSSEVETVISNIFKHSRYFANSGYLQVLKRSNKTCGGNLLKIYFSDQGQITP